MWKTKYFVKLTMYLNFLGRNVVFTKFFSKNVTVKTSQCVVKREISSDQLFSVLFSKSVAFTKFLPKKRESKFLYANTTLHMNAIVKHVISKLYQCY